MIKWSRERAAAALCGHVPRPVAILLAVPLSPDGVPSWVPLAARPLIFFCVSFFSLRVVVYFVGDDKTEQAILAQIAEAIGEGVKPVVNTIPIPELCYPCMLIELEAVAMKATGNQNLPRESFTVDGLSPIPSAFSHVIRCGDVVFTSDISAIAADGVIVDPDNVIAQTTIMMKQLCTALAAAGSQTLRNK